MASTTSNLALYKPTVGGDTDAWGTQLNANMDILDNAATLTGTQTLTNKTISGSSNTLTNVSLTTSVTGTLPVANGGTGGTTHTANNVLLGNGTSAFQAVAPGTSGNILTSNGTTWVSSAPASGGSGTVTSVNVSGGSTGLSFSGGPITTSGTITAGGTLAVGYGGTGSSTLDGAGIVTKTGSQTASGNKTFTGGAAFGSATSAGSTQALVVQPNGTNSATYVGLLTQNNGACPGAVMRTDSTSTSLVSYNYSGTEVGFITTNGSTCSLNNFSDYRLKENIAQLTGAADKLKQLSPKTFTWKSNPSVGTTEGFIAHELQAVIPQAVNGAKDAVNEEGQPRYQGVDTTVLIPLLTAALQEALARIEALEAASGV